MSEIAEALEMSKQWVDKLYKNINNLANTGSTPIDKKIELTEQYNNHVNSKKSIAAEINKKYTEIKKDIMSSYEHSTGLYWHDKPFPYIKNLALAGGGGKGLAYPGVYSALCETGYIKDLESVSGSSAGALTGAAIACGADPTWLARIIRDLPYAGAMVAGRLKFDNLTVMTGTGCDSGQELYGIFRSIYLVSFVSNMQKCVKDIEAAVAQKRISAKQLDDLIRLARGENDKLTFSILNTMQIVRCDIFKGLTITGSRIVRVNDASPSEKLKMIFKSIVDSIDKSITKMDASHLGGMVKFDIVDLKTEYFSNERFGDMEIALAARISMSLPGLFDIVLFSGEDGKEWKMIDGGMTSNVPLEVFYNATDADNKTMFELDCSAVINERNVRGYFNRAMDSTMVVVPKNSGAQSTENMLSRPPGENDIAAIFEGALQLKDEVIRYDWRKVHIAGRRSVLAMPHGGLSTTGFLMAKAGEIMEAQREAFSETISFLAGVVDRKAL